MTKDAPYQPSTDRHSGGWVFSGLVFEVIDYGLPDRRGASFDVIDDYILVLSVNSSKAAGERSRAKSLLSFALAVSTSRSRRPISTSLNFGRLSCLYPPEGLHGFTAAGRAGRLVRTFVPILEGFANAAPTSRATSLKPWVFRPRSSAAAARRWPAFDAASFSCPPALPAASRICPPVVPSVRFSSSLTGNAAATAAPAAMPARATAKGCSCTTRVIVSCKVLCAC